jgi:hypothetical protein
MMTEVRTIHLPTGARVAALPTPGTLETPFGRATLTVERRGDAVVVGSELALERSRVAPHEYPAFRAFCAKADALLAQRLAVTVP